MKAVFLATWGLGTYSEVMTNPIADESILGIKHNTKVPQCYATVRYFSKAIAFYWPDNKLFESDGK